MNEKLMEKIRESLEAVVPITIIVVLLTIIFVPMPTGTFVMFLIGALMLIVGMGLFQLGADMSMTPMGDGVGEKLVSLKKQWIVGGVCFLIGIIITVAEPDLTVLANQVTAIPNMFLILTVAVGVGFYLLAATVRILLHIPLRYFLLVSYGAVIALVVFVPQSFISVAFDSGGVTTGPVTVPFIISLGVGLAALRGDKSSEDDSFGLVALCSIGPIIAVMILGICFNPADASISLSEITEAATTQQAWWHIFTEFPEYLKEVAIALVPIMAFFAVFQLFTRQFRARQIARMGIGIVYTYVGLVLFLTGANVGFMPVGVYLGKQLASLPYSFIIIPIGMIIGYFIVKAEPAVHVLGRQVEEITGGAITQKTLFGTLSIGVAVSVGVAMVRVLTGISLLWFTIPGYVIAVVLTFFVPNIFTGVAFDSGGVASGPMTATFLLPFAEGACAALGGNIITDAFGVVAMVAMTPVIAIQILGVSYKIKTRKASMEKVRGLQPDDDDIIDYEVTET